MALAPAVLRHVANVAAMVALARQNREGADFQNAEVQYGETELDHAGDELWIAAEANRTRRHPLASVRAGGEASLQPIRRPEATAQRGGRGAKAASVGRGEGLQEFGLRNGVRDVRHDETVAADDGVSLAARTRSGCVS